MMSKLFFALSAVLLVACGEGSGYEINGTLNNSSEIKNVYLSELDDNQQPQIVDTLEVVEGKFSADLAEVDTPKISFLSLEGVRGNMMFIADNTPINFEIYPDSLSASKIEGGKDNQVLMDYAATMRASQEELDEVRSRMMEAFSKQDTAAVSNIQNEQVEIVDQMKLKKKELVEKNPNSLIAVLVMQEMVGTKMFPTSELQELYNNMSPAIKKTFFGKEIEKGLESLSLVDIGNKAPNFSGPTPEGETLSLNEVLGKVTLIDFWASWCKPCRDENPNIVRVYEKYHDKGFNAIGVSLDRQGQKDKWIQAIEDDKLSWAQISNLQFWQDPIAQQYGIRAIPAAFLLDENGVIVAKNLRGAALEQKVAELLGE